MAEEKKITRADGTSSVKTKEERKGAAMPKRILAIVFWVLGIVCEALAICVLNKYFYVSDQLLWLIIFIVADLIMVIIGSQFWKKANDIDPASKANKVKYFLWNQMGLIVSIIAFFPLVVLLLKNKDLDEDEISDYITEHFEGNSLIAAGDEDLIKIHFHTNEPWKILEYCNTVGEIYDIVVEDMIRQSAGLQG